MLTLALPKAAPPPALTDLTGCTAPSLLLAETQTDLVEAAGTEGLPALAATAYEVLIYQVEYVLPSSWVVNVRLMGKYLRGVHVLSDVS